MLEGLGRSVEDTLAAVSARKSIAIAVWTSSEEVKWGRFKNLRNVEWNLVVAHWSKDLNTLFVYSSNYDAFRPDNLVEELTGRKQPKITGEKLFRIYSNFERPMARNLGAAKEGSIRFTMYFGSDVTEGMEDYEKGRSVLSNVFAWGYEDGERVTAGCSVRKGKVWGRGGGPIDHWLDWCYVVGKKVNDESVDGKKVFSEFLLPREVEERPPLVPIAIDWGQRIMEDVEGNYSVRIEGEEFQTTDIELELTDRSDSGPIRFIVRSDAEEATYELEIAHEAGGEHKHFAYRHVEGAEVLIRRGKGEERPLEDFLDEDSPVITYVDTSFSYANVFVEAPVEYSLPSSELTTYDWSSAGVDITVESEGSQQNPKAIQYRMIEDRLADWDIVINDDGANEIADIVAIKQQDPDTILMELVHCKYSSSDTAGARLKDVYEVAGQAIRSAKWKSMGIPKVYKHIKHREKLWKKNHGEKSSRFRKGSLERLKFYEKLSRRAKIKFSIVIVQPGLSEQKVGIEILRVLGSVKSYVGQTTRADFTVLVGE